jgi:hypothetical protein
VVVSASPFGEIIVMSKNMFEFTFYSACLFVLCVISMAVWSFQAKMEASAFNRLTGAKVSTWDAMWVELRVDVPVLK